MYSSRALSYGIIPRSPNSPELRPSLLEQHSFTYPGSVLRLLHAAAATAAGGEEEDQKDPEKVAAFRRIQSNIRYPYPTLRFITFGQAQNDLGAESRETWERERYADHMASFLPISSTSQAKDERSKRSSYGTHKADKLFINTLRKDKGLQTQDWRIAFSNLLKHSTPEKTDQSDYATGSVDRSQTQDLRASNGDLVAARRVISESRNYRSFRLARQIFPPAKWSEANLAVYVEALTYSERTQSRIPWVQKPQLKGWTNIEDIATALDEIFYGMDSQKFLTVKACNTALRFFYKHNMMAKARALYIRMEDLKMCISTETFNILLRGSASQRDLHSFTFLLSVMTRRGFKPDEWTWTLFLQVIDSSKGRAIVVQRMAQMNMLDNLSIRRLVARHMIHDEIADHLGDGHDRHSFLDHMNNKYGVGWLSTSAGNRLLNEVAKRQSAAESLSLLYEMKQASFMPNDISMNTLLTHCLPLRQYDLAFEILAVFKNLYRLYPRLQVYETLFGHVWSSNLLNLSIVVWRTASIYGAVSRNMRYQVFRSLLSYTPALDKPIKLDDVADLGNLNRSAKFRKFAGRFVIGLGRPGGAALSRAMESLELSPQRRTIKWAQSLLQISHRMSRAFVLEADLSQKLREALTMDKSWAAEGLYDKDDWRDMFPHAITVPVKVNRLARPCRPLLRLRKHGYRGSPATRLVTRQRNLLRDPERRSSRPLNLALQTRMKIRRIRANLPAMRPLRIWPIRIESPSSTIGRRPLPWQSSRSMVRLRPRKRKA